MNLEILSSNEALKYVPKDKTYAIRIFNEFTYFPEDLMENNNWVKINGYSFDDVWPKTWKEYSWLDSSEPVFSHIFNESWREMTLKYPKMTWDSFIGWVEYAGHPYGRVTPFDEEFASKILDDYEEFGRDSDTVLIHSSMGRYRPSAVGIAMNEIYEWGVKGLKDKFPNYRKFVYDILKSVR